MKIDLTAIDQAQFMVHSHVLHGEVVFLVQPQHIGAKFDQKNKIFRSSLWNSDGELISAGFPKFTNWGENPEHFPVPTSLKHCVVTEKLDGSLLIVSKYKGNFILRTRGTVDARNLDNGHELLIFEEKYPEVFKFQGIGDTWPFSLLFEWTSPENRIVCHYGTEPTFSLIGCVHHEDYKLWTQEYLDVLAKGLGVPRPPTYRFDNVEQMLADIEKWEKKEGVVVYSRDDQQLHKVKCAWYLVRHRMKEEFGNFEKVLDFYLSEGMPDFHAFQEKVATLVDWETAQEIIGDISTCVDARKDVQAVIDGMQGFVTNRLVPFGDTRDKKVRGMQARTVLQAYGDTNRASFVFKLLDGKPLETDDWKKLFYQVTKK